MKPFKFLLFFSVFVFAACGEDKAPPTELPTTDLTIVPGERVGLITAAKCTREDVLAAYGKDAKVDSVYLFEGMMGEGVVLFPNDARRTVSIYWDNDRSKKRPAFIRIMGDSTGSDWKTTDGITIGSSMMDVQKLNGGSFEVSGFGWDYGGYVTSWREGKFNSSLGLQFQPSTTDKVSDMVLGEGGFSSELAEALAAKPVVSRMEFRFLANEKLPDCIMEKVKADQVEGKMVVHKMVFGGKAHFWLQSGAAAYDGIELIYDEDCEEVCKLGGFRKPMDCMTAYENGHWEVVWEEQ